jgi:intracellular septation protein A
MDDKTNNYVRQIVWNTVEYRWVKFCFSLFLINCYSKLYTKRNFLRQQFRL